MEYNKSFIIIGLLLKYFSLIIFLISSQRVLLKLNE